MNININIKLLLIFLIINFMDPYNLLINNLPFDENKLQILDQALSVFYFTKINSEVLSFLM